MAYIGLYAVASVVPYIVVGVLIVVVRVSVLIVLIVLGGLVFIPIGVALSK